MWLVKARAMECVAADKNEDGSVVELGTDISHVRHVAVSIVRCYGNTGGRMRY